MQRDELKLEGENLNEVESFKYLGTIVSISGILEIELNERLKEENQAMGRLSKIWKSNRLKSHIKIRLHEYISFVRLDICMGMNHSTIMKLYHKGLSI